MWFCKLLVLKELLAKRRSWGSSELGKPRLCQDVFNDKDVKEAYLPRVWVSMYSKESEEGEEDPKVAVLKRILGSLGVKVEELDHIRTKADEEKRKKKR